MNNEDNMPMIIYCVCRTAVAEKLLPHNFDLAFRALHAFGGARPACTFAAVAASLARRDDLASLKNLLQSVQGTITDEEWDEVQYPFLENSNKVRSP